MNVKCKGKRVRRELGMEAAGIGGSVRQWVVKAAGERDVGTRQSQGHAGDARG